MRHWATKEAGVTSIKMIAEGLLHIAMDASLIPILVQKGALGLILDLKSSVLDQSTESMLVSREALINLAQSAAKLCLRTNPTTLPESQQHGLSSLIFKYLLDDKSHHELLQFEGLMALTNLASHQGIVEKLATIGVWGRTCSIVGEVFEKTEQQTSGQIQTVVAACELLANLSLCEYIQG